VEPTRAQNNKENEELEKMKRKNEICTKYELAEQEKEDQ